MSRFGATEHFRCGQSELSCPAGTKYMLDFKTSYEKKKKKCNYFIVVIG